VTFAPVEDSQATAVRLCLKELSDLFHDHFEQNWLLFLLERFPMDAVAMNEVRELMHPDVAFLDPAQLAARLAMLDGYVLHLRRYLLPGLREKLGISGLLPATHRVLGRDQMLMRKLVAYTFPYNLERMQRLADELRGVLGTFPEAAQALSA
jgi:hypothetical protein